MKGQDKNLYALRCQLIILKLCYEIYFENVVFKLCCFKIQEKTGKYNTKILRTDHC